ncbi:hypothetical protein Trydic_g21213 [Trypoxylus dichotomus]
MDARDTHLYVSSLESPKRSSETASDVHRCSSARDGPADSEINVSRPVLGTPGLLFIHVGGYKLKTHAVRNTTPVGDDLRLCGRS